MNEKIVKKDNLVEIKNNQTAIITSMTCDEYLIICNNKNLPYGAEIHKIDKIKYSEDVETKCIEAGLPAEFVYLNANGQGEVYVNMECAKSTLPSAIMVKEVEEDGKTSFKLCKVLVQNNNQDNSFGK